MKGVLVTGLLMISCILLKAQFSDDFTDGDYTANPVWTDDSSKFEVLTGELHLNDASQTDPGYIFTPSQSIDSAVWEFYVRLEFDPSSSNYAKAYIVSNASDLSGSLNGYFVQIGGVSGTVDDISLYRQDGTGSTLLIDGRDGTVGTAPSVKIKVTRDDIGNWELLSDTNTTGTYISEGTATDSTYTSTSYFGFECIYTATRSDKFYFDSINVTGDFPVDSVAPQITSVTVLSDTTLDVYFDENLDGVTAEMAANYSLDNGIGTPVSAVQDGGNASLVHLTFGTAFTSGTDYILTVNGVEDLSTNAVVNEQYAFTYFIPGYKDIVINEIFPDPTPSVGLPGEEYIELYNTSANDIDLVNWEFSDGGTPAVFGSKVLASGAYLIVCATSNVALFSGYGDVLSVSGFPTLNNGGDNLTLKDGLGTVIDEANYTTDWYNNAAKSDGGWSMELKDPAYPCNSSLNWQASEDSSGGTPGKVNSVYQSVADSMAPEVTNSYLLDDSTVVIEFNEQLESASINVSNFSVTGGVSASAASIGADKTSVVVSLSTSITANVIYTLEFSLVEDCIGNAMSLTSIEFGKGLIPSDGDLIINEIYPDENPTNGLPDAEFVEIYNTTSDILDLSGMMFTDFKDTMLISSFTLYPSEYLILSGTALYDTFGVAYSASSFPGLNNAGEAIALLNSDGSVHSYVDYDLSFYNDDTKESGGWSMELKDPGFPCVNNVLNWSASISSIGGTPGKENSNIQTVVDNDAPNVEKAYLLNDSTLYLKFNEQIDPSSVSVSNLTISGGLTVTTTSVGVGNTDISVSFSPNVTINTLYTLQISGVKDCIGNLMASASIDFGKGIVPLANSLVINEIYPDINPSYGLPDAEYVEVYNRTSDILDLSGMIFTDSKDTMVISSLTLLPFDYVVMSESILYDTFGVSYISSSFPSLNDAGETLSLLNSDRTIHSSVTYDKSFYNDSDKDDGGWSLELKNADNPCGANYKSNWSASVELIGGTPGYENSIVGTLVDVTNPSLLRAVALNSFTVEAHFDEQLLPSSVDSLNFSIDNGITISAVTPETESSVVRIDLATSLTEKVVYTLTVNNILDCSNNQIQAGSTAQFGLPEFPEVGDIIINEVLFNPRTGGSDFVEFYNNSDKFIDMQNFVFLDLKDTVLESSTITEDNIVVSPEGYVVFTPNPDNIIIEYPNGAVENIFEADLPSYNDSEGDVIIGILNSALVADSFHYSEDMHFELIDDEDGVSLERISFNLPTNDENNWHSAASAVGYATPGYQNSQSTDFSGTLADKFTIEPEIFTPDEDGYNDYTMFYYELDEPGYMANITIFDSYGRPVRYLVRNQLLATRGFYQWDGINEEGRKILVGNYVVLFEIFDTQGNVEKFKKIVSVGAQF